MCKSESNLWTCFIDSINQLREILTRAMFPSTDSPIIFASKFLTDSTGNSYNSLMSSSAKSEWVIKLNGIYLCWSTKIRRSTQNKCLHPSLVSSSFSSQCVDCLEWSRTLCLWQSFSPSAVEAVCRPASRAKSILYARFADSVLNTILMG